MEVPQRYQNYRCTARLFHWQTGIDDHRALRRIEENKPCLYPKRSAALSTTP